MITKKDRYSAKWVRLFEQTQNLEELQFAHEICEKILKIRHYRKSWEDFVNYLIDKERKIWI